MNLVQIRFRRMVSSTPLGVVDFTEDRCPLQGVSPSSPTSKLKRDVSTTMSTKSGGRTRVSEPLPERLCLVEEGCGMKLIWTKLF